MTQSERLNFPGLRPEEAVVLRDWLRLHEAEYDTFEYDVSVGAGRDPGAEYSEAVRRGAIENSQLRIDAVARKGGSVTIVEVKDRARPGVIGQIVSYRALWRAQHPGEPEPRCIVVARSLLEGVEAGLRDVGVEVELVAIASGVTS